MRDVLRRLLAGELTEDEAIAELRKQQLDELDGRARLDLGRFMRRGVPEVVLATGKTPAEAARLAVALAERQGQGLVSRMTDSHRASLRESAAAAGMKVVEYRDSARVPPRSSGEPTLSSWLREWMACCRAWSRG